MSKPAWWRERRARDGAGAATGSAVPAVRPPASLRELVQKALEEADGDVDEAKRLVRKAITDDAALAAVISEALLERAIETVIDAIADAAEAKTYRPRGPSAPAKETIDGLKLKAGRLMAEILFSTDRPLADATAQDLEREMGILRAEMAETITRLRFYELVASQLAPGQRVHQKFSEAALSVLHAQAVRPR